MTWLLDCFRHRISPEDCDPNGCSKCIHWKELEEKFKNMELSNDRDT